ncbi:MAG TPA: glycosyltransferase family 1 protein [Verrucomicrobiae bacterium]|nr:glycosyltransferase family 1 protein [Verrucomicrobiae bacterium]
MTIILSGTIGLSGLGGQAWAVLQYLLGFRALGHEVFYLEDCGRSSWVYIWETEEWTHELDYPAAYVHACLEPFGLGDRWIYRDNYRSLGMPLDHFLGVCARADLLLMRAAPFWTWRTEYEKPRRRAFLDVDPGFTQIILANGDRGWLEGISRAERRFTCGQHIGQPGCPAPDIGGPWLKTRPPVFLQEWPVAGSAATHFTSVMRWQGFKEVTWNGVAYGQRDKEFQAYLELPWRTTQKFLIAQMGAKPELLTGHGWEVALGEVVSRTPETYRQFIAQSRAEFSVPKNGYVMMRGGWFSDRSVCYLASGRPVLIEDTGLHDWLPVGEGLLTFQNPDEALAGVDAINANYERHRRAARRIAEEQFATEKVLPALLEEAMA